VVFRAAAASLPDHSTLAALDALLALDGERIDYRDGSQGVERIARVVDGRLVGLRLCGDISGVAWLGEWLESGVDVDALGARLLAGGLHPPQGMANRGRIICSCHNVGEADIVACFAAGGLLADAQRQLKCGTGCGSCVPELKRIAAKAGGDHVERLDPIVALAA
jgi:assimilatory nitrate reductase catalytic subunit